MTRTLEIPELLLERSECYAQLGDFDQAIKAMERALAAGLKMVPDGRTDIADLLLRAGRADEAHTLYEQVKADTPDDVWVYNDAGLSYQFVGDHERALRWLTEGLELALKTGDTERLVPQLSECRRKSLKALGCGLDRLEARADDFLARASSPKGGCVETTRSDTPNTEVDAGAGAPWQMRSWTSPARGVPRDRVAVLAVAWLPPKEFQAALRMWPDFKNEWEADGYEGYCRCLQATLVNLASVGLSPLLAPVRMDVYTRWCARAGLSPDSSRARSEYAAELARHGEAVHWPPGRNKACWCGSGFKYKKCCGRTASATYR